MSRLRLEQMKPEFEFYKTAKLFSTTELRKLYNRREYFEQRLVGLRSDKSKNARLYLQHLEATRQVVARRCEKTKPGLTQRGQSFTISTITALYERMLTAVGHRTHLWFEYLDWTRKYRGQKAEGVILGRLIQRFPQSIPGWRRLGNYSRLVGINRARGVYQRATRLLNRPALLFLDWAEAEWTFAQRLGGGVDIKRDDGMTDGMYKVLRGDIARLLFRSGLEATAKGRAPEDLDTVRERSAFLEEAGEVLGASLVERWQRDDSDGPPLPVVEEEEFLFDIEEPSSEGSQQNCEDK
eukprot:gnl/Dysnectes_brevis/4203_a5554_634.p1 GENE.gnl/Dysnectes_brevis/4203_a5554_634~~gnl/Dysnectes_brevis/4203_a5554_634.p1  ORF type:complete len:296 (+),score=74.18 gnl/Dysnectes_brevis/4203_a5554_634:13-900(+)